jgi:hypothetical protein
LPTNYPEFFGQFVLSINGTPLECNVFSRFRLEEVETTYNIAVAATGSGSEQVH